MELNNIDEILESLRQEPKEVDPWNDQISLFELTDDDIW